MLDASNTDETFQARDNRQSSIEIQERFPESDGCSVPTPPKEISCKAYEKALKEFMYDE